jgi:hypothetical protein
MTTFTASLHQSQPREIHAGLQTASSKVTVAVTGTAGSVFLVAKVPNQAHIKDFWLFADDAGADQTWSVGIVRPEGSTSGSITILAAVLLAATSISGGSTTIRPAGGLLPYKISISDEALPRWAWIAVTAATAISASADLRFVVTYDMDDDNMG